MGGCASRPKEADLNPDSLPSEVPATPKAEAGTVAEGNKGGENQNETAALVDLSEPKQEGGDSSAESNTADAQPVSPTDQTKPTEDKVEAPAKETQVEASKVTTEPAAKEGQDVVATPLAETPKEVAAPSSEVKSDAPLVTV